MNIKIIKFRRKICLSIGIFIILLMIVFLNCSESFFKAYLLLNNNKSNKENKVLVIEYESLKLDYPSNNREINKKEEHIEDENEVKNIKELDLKRDSSK